MNYENIRIFNVNVYELHLILKLIKDYDDFDMLDMSLDDWFILYKHTIKNFYNIDVKKNLDILLGQASKFLKYTYKSKSTLLGNFEYTIHKDNVLRVDITFIKLIASLNKHITEDVGYNIEPLIPQISVDPFKYYVEHKLEGYEDAKIDLVSIDMSNLKDEDAKIMNWLNNEVNIEKGNLFQTRLREDIVASYLPPIELRRPHEEIDIVISPNFSKFSKELPDDMRTVINIVEHAQITKHPYAIYMTFFDSLKSFFKINFYKECMFHRQYIKEVPKTSLYPIIRQQYTGEYIVEFKNDIHCVSHDTREIILKWVDLAEERLGLKNIMFEKILIESLDDVFF